MFMFYIVVQFIFVFMLFAIALCFISVTVRSNALRREGPLYVYLHRILFGGQFLFDGTL